MSIRILAIGKKHETWVSAGIERYQKRLSRPFLVEWALLPHSTLSEHEARSEESDRILSRIKPDEFVILLDERGKAIDSPALSKLLLSPLELSKPTTVIIGGAYGVTQTLQSRADFVWSLSPLVFPHQLVRLLLIEQIYRSQEIAGNKPYHHT